MSAIINGKDIDVAADLLFNIYGISAQMLHKYCYPNDWHATISAVNNGLYKLNKDILKKDIHGYNFCRLVVTKEGYNMFSGKEKAKFRKTLLEKLDASVIDNLYKQFCPDGTYQAKGYQTTALSKLKWVNGKKWAHAFVSATSFPKPFAGIVRNGDKVPTFERIPPKTKEIKLKPFQNDLKNRMKEILNMQGDKTRCIVTLPTGGGKTRVAVEAFIEWMQPRFSQGMFLIWIAQSEELCDQASACIKDMWSQREFTEDLSLIRYYKGSKVPLDLLEESTGGVIVASIVQLHKRIEANSQEINFIIQNTGAIIIDEAHRAVTYMYENLFDKAKQLCHVDLFPVCGLSATPGRGPLGQFDTQNLVNIFEAKLIKPCLENEPDYDALNPLEYFKKHGYLARATHEFVHNNVLFKLNEEQLQKLQEIKENNDGTHEFVNNYELTEEKDRKLLRHLALDNNRNTKIVSRLLKIPIGSKTLVYTCTVDHAIYLASIMTLLGRKSCAVSADTATTERRMIISDFKEGKIEFIFNYGVLTTGFDAPKTDHIVLCRPILSDVLYEQIVGRGMRGPEFGGTKNCHIIDFADTIENMGLPLAYERYSHYWDE